MPSGELPVELDDGEVARVREAVDLRRVAGWQGGRVEVARVREAVNLRRGGAQEWRRRRAGCRGRRAGGLACEIVAVNLEAQKLKPVDLAIRCVGVSCCILPPDVFCLCFTSAGWTASTRSADRCSPGLCWRMVGIGALSLRIRDEHLHEEPSLRIVLEAKVMRRPSSVLEDGWHRRAVLAHT